MCSRVYIVQDRESGYFLRPDVGDVGFTVWVDEAGVFDSEDAAVDTGSGHCSEGFLVFAFFSGGGCVRGR